MWSQFWWVIYPYLTLGLMVIGAIYRVIDRPIGWGSRSSEILEKNMLRWGSRLFHWGIIFVFGGHVVGLLVPIQVFHALGIPDEMYHVTADIFGGLAGIAAWLGMLILLLRRLFHPRVRKNSSVADILAVFLLFLVITIGDAVTLIYNNVVGPYEYRTTVNPWIRDVLVFHPDKTLMLHVPLIIQIHIVVALALLAVSPFTRLVHIWSLPIRYAVRAPIQYRARHLYQKRVG